jgi:DNA-binding transcriptional MerR regulator
MSLDKDYKYMYLKLLIELTSNKYYSEKKEELIRFVKKLNNNYVDLDKKKIDLEKEFEKETGLKCTIPNFIYSDGYYNDEYVEFLEKRSNELTERLEGQFKINRELEKKLH